MARITFVTQESDTLVEWPVVPRIGEKVRLRDRTWKVYDVKWHPVTTQVGIKDGDCYATVTLAPLGEGR